MDTDKESNMNIIPDNATNDICFFFYKKFSDITTKGEDVDLKSNN